MTTFTKHPSGSWRVQIRRKGLYAMAMFRRHRDAQLWALEMECHVVRRESISAERPKHIKRFGDLIDPHIASMHEVDKP